METELRKFCEGCNSSSLWNDKGRSCADGKSCYHQLVAARKIAVTYLPDGYHQNLAEWGDSSDLQKWRRILQRIFYVPVPADSKLSLPPAPCANDLVLSFRCYHGARIFDPKDLRLLTPPFDFFKFAVEHHRRHKDQCSEPPNLGCYRASDEKASNCGAFAEGVERPSVDRQWE